MIGADRMTRARSRATARSTPVDRHSSDHVRRRGFTLIELIAVMAVVALIGAAVAAPTLSYLTTMKARGAANRLAADIRYAQRWAMSTRLRTWVVLSVAGNSYQLYVENPASPGKAGRVSMGRASDNATGSVSVGESPFSGTTLTSVNINGGSEVEFDTLGRPYDTSSTLLTANGAISLSSSVSVSVTAVSGLCEVSG